jgi:hypothetical protein
MVVQVPTSKSQIVFARAWIPAFAGMTEEITAKAATDDRY